MRIYAFILTCILAISQAFGQTPISTVNPPQGGGDRLNLVSSRYSIIKDQNSIHSIVPVYEHKGNTLSADSGLLYEDPHRNQFFEAFGNVVITQPSGTVIYADRLHYDAVVQLARLFGNVKMVDKNSTLTTNYLTYNLKSKVGTYTGGGRIISQTDTITSKNAFYFENTSDAYFRYDVVVRNPQVRVYTDSMRYNSLSKLTYFFGPTNIKGNNKENLYTERGTYNTATGIANFNKNNLYTEGSKFLKGDSLHYDRASGIGEAFRNVVFVDTLDKFYAYGGRGLYKQTEESILMTEKPYIITVVKNDNGAKDSIAVDSTDIKSSKSKKELKKEQKEKEKEKIEAQQKENTEATKEIVHVQDEKKKSAAASQPETSGEQEKHLLPADTLKKPLMDSVYMTADTLYSRMILRKDYKPLNLNLKRDGGELITEDNKDYGDDEDANTDDNTAPLDDLSTDSLTAASVDANPLASKTQDSLQKKDAPKSVAPLKANSKAKPATATTATSTAARIAPSKKRDDGISIESTLKADSILRKKAVIPKANTADTLINKALLAAQSQDATPLTNRDSISKDSLTQVPADTARTRIVKAFYNVRLYKSDLQAVADSVYYGMADSMFRFMGRPMIWAQGSQISSDTIFMQIVNQQIDNALLINNAFMVNVVQDTLKYNQLKGRKITAFFENNEMEKLFVDGNAENLVFSVNDKTKTITEMFHDRGARIKVFMKNKELIDYYTIRKVDQKVYPFKLVTQDNEILPGFIWRPQDRPTSKEDLLNRKREGPKTENTNSDKATKGNEKKSDSDEIIESN
ncbi:OstA-like protein [Sphingobacterium sp. Mn56C]|uniref:OstA-like protein n=1 Tax=Sphingobacterium sp. Mn56C TaxID=3395261 RepID=UPI003BD04984